MNQKNDPNTMVMPRSEAGSIKKDVPKIIWLKELAKELGYSDRTIRRFVAEGRIRHVRIGNKLGFLPDHVVEFINDHTIAASNKPAYTNSATKRVLEQMRNRVTKG